MHLEHSEESEFVELNLESFAMSRKERETEGEASETPIAGTVQLPTVAGINPTQLSPYAVNALQALAGGQQLPFLDSNVMLMTNAAIAAVAASAVQQMNQGKASPVPPSGANAPQSIPPALMAALRGASLPPTTSSSALSPHIAALLVGGAGAHPALKMPGSASVPPHLHQVLGHEASSLRQPTTATSLTNGSTNASVVSGAMQGWTLEQLEKHVTLLQQMNKPVPQSVALLLADARRKEKKKTAKRAANRKSASTSRARKKALVEEMTRTNARLKRQALILELLPDLVIATTLDGEITFCSAQVGRVLKHKDNELLGASLSNLLVPASRDIFKKIIKELKDSKSGGSRQKQQQSRRAKKRRRDEEKTISDRTGKEDPNGNVAGPGNKPALAISLVGDGKCVKKAAAIVSEKSFPLSIVNVESKQSTRLASTSKQGEGHGVDNTINVNSDTSTSNNSGSKQQVSSLSNATGLSRSPNESQSEDDGAQGGSQEQSQGSKEEKRSTKGKQHPSSDESSLSSEAKNMRKANDNLDRNVRWHNQRMMEDSQKAISDDGPKDDVTGASVTANNASARLSSLQHVPELQTKKEEKVQSTYENNGDQSSSDDSLLAGVEEKKNQSDDSGYRESNDSREETSSSGSDSSNLNGRKSPLIPTYRLCLIRDDLSTVWCEVTSSLRKQAPDEETPDLQQGTSKSTASPVVESPKPEVIEVLLCLRPIREGEKKVDESLRFVSPRASSSDESFPEDHIATSPKSSNQEKELSGNGSNSNSVSSENASPKRPSEDILEQNHKRIKGEEATNNPRASDTEKSVVESLMLMNKFSQ